MKNLNGGFGMYYRRANGGKGYVFQGRYYSSVIEEGNYLLTAIGYVLLNPVRAGLVDDPYDYRWSSIGEYFSDEGATVVDSGFVEGLFGDRHSFVEFLEGCLGIDKLEAKCTRFGYVLGSDEFAEEAAVMSDRRRVGGRGRRMRVDDDRYVFESAEEVVEGFEREKGVEIEEIDVRTREGRMLRNELLVLLKDRAGLTYGEIIKYAPFRNLKYKTLSWLYRTWSVVFRNSNS